MYWRLRHLGAEVIVADSNEATNSSQAAAGLITPITGLNFALSWRFDEIWPKSLQFYEELANDTGRAFFTPLPVVRLFGDETEAAKFTKKLANHPELEKYVDQVFTSENIPTELIGSAVNQPHGGFVMPGGWVNTSALIDETRSELVRTSTYREKSVTAESLDLPSSNDPDHPLRWDGEVFDTVVFCEGAHARHNPLFSSIPYRPAKGEFLTVSAPQATSKAIINRRGNWLAPRDAGQWRAGSTYDFDHLNTKSTEAGRTQILANITTFYSGELCVTDASAGIRPIIRKSQPVAGFHADYPGTIAMLNGLGSKGCTTAPWAAGHLAHAIVNGRPLPPYLDLEKLSENPQ